MPNTATYLNSFFDIIFDVLDFLLLLSETQQNTIYRQTSVDKPAMLFFLFHFLLKMTTMEFREGVSRYRGTLRHAFDWKRGKQTFVGMHQRGIMSTVTDSCLYKTFGHSVTGMFLIKATRQPVSLSFTLSQPGQQHRDECLQQFSVSDKGGDGLVLLASFFFF